ncbi:hypothetical protein FRC06_011612 [Ceratobasidium sp. 370]|nr:hypothetical protein FRC06_011612 [Ceratobasidium sp. 370]
MPDLLDASALLGNVPNILPGSTTTLSSPQDALAVLLHAAMTALSFRLVAIDETAPDQEPEAGTTPGQLPESWSSKGPDVYTFRYKHDQSSLTFLLKLVKLSGRVIVHGIAVEDDKTKSFEINTQDYFSTSFFPRDAKSTDQPLVHGYISSSRVADLIALFKTSIIQPLIPGLRKEGYQESATTSTAATSGPASAGRAPQNPLRDPSPPPRLDRPFSHPYGSHIPPDNPLRIGRSDLDPLGGRGNPFAPPPLFGPAAGGDGMFVGPDHPMFSDPLRRGGRGGIEPTGPWGGDGYLPPMGAPPGARFDPIGPGPLSGRAPGRRPPYMSGNPDNDEFMPPGTGNNHDMYM